MIGVRELTDEEVLEDKGSLLVRSVMQRSGGRVRDSLINVMAQSQKPNADQIWSVSEWDSFLAALDRSNLTVSQIVKKTCDSST